MIRNISNGVLSEEQMRLFLENIEDLVFIYRLKPSPSYDYVNQASTNITGYTPQEFYADPALGMKTIHPDDSAIFEKILRGAIFNKTVNLRWVKKTAEQSIWNTKSSLHMMSQVKLRQFK